MSSNGKGVNVKIGTIWNPQGFNAVFELWNRWPRLKVWPPKSGGFKNGGGKGPEKETNIPINVIYDLYNFMTKVVKMDVGSGMSKIYRVKDKTSGAWNNVLIYSLVKEAGPNYMYKMTFHFCADNVSFEFPFTKSEIVVYTSDQPDLEEESRWAMMNFLRTFSPEAVAPLLQMSTGSIALDESGPTHGNGNSNARYNTGSSEEDIPY